MADFPGTKSSGGFAGKNKLVYSEGLNTTYVLSPDGKTQLGYMDGDQRDNPLAAMGDSAAMHAPVTKESIRTGIEQKGRDFVTNAASMAPLMIPGLGPEASLGMRALMHVVRVGGSLAAGYGTDSLVNPEKTSSDKMSDAGLNTALGLIIPWALENKLRIKMPGNVSEITSRTSTGPTVVSRETANTGSSGTRGTSTSSGTTKSSSEGSSSGKGSGNSSGVTSSSGKSANTMERTSVTRDFEDEITDTPHMDALRAEIDRLKKIEPKNKSQTTQINNAIARNQDAYDAAADLNSGGGGRITKTTGSSTGENSGSGSRSGQSTNEQSSTHTNKSNNESSSGSNSQSQSSSSGTSTTTGTSQPGDSVTSSTTRSSGHTLIERLMEMMNSAHVDHVKNLTGLQKFLAGFLGNDAVDVTINQSSTKK